MKIIFLDHFGVMCLANKHGIEKKHNDLPNIDEFRKFGEFDNFDSTAVEILNSIIIKTDAEIVISSDWKNWTNLDSMKDFYKSQGVIKSPIDFTPIFSKKNIPENYIWNPKMKLQQKRSLEILTWLENHPGVSHWVCIDDLYLKGEDWGLSNFVWISRTDEGISQSGVKEIIINFLF